MSSFYWGTKYKYCFICSIAQCVREHNCFKNWAGSSTAMESDIIVEGFNLSESMHGLRYMQFIGDRQLSSLLRESETKIAECRKKMYAVHRNSKARS